MVPLTRNMQRVYLQFRALGGNLDGALRRAAQLYDLLGEQIHHTPLPHLAEQLAGPRVGTWSGFSGITAALGPVLTEGRWISSLSNAG